MIAKQTTKETQQSMLILLTAAVRIRGKWKNHFDLESPKNYLKFMTELQVT